MRKTIGASTMTLFLSLALAGCGDADDASDGGADSAPDAGEPSKISERSFGPFEDFATPIADYADYAVTWEYDRSVNELHAFGDRLWIGYGDGTVNMGTKIPIEFRFLASAKDAKGQAAEVDGEDEGAPQPTPTASGEEVIERYRLCDGALWQAGLDSNDPDELWTQANTDPKAIQGNVYNLAGDVWKKHRAIPGGEHVQDIGAWDGALYAVGSGADLRSEFETYQIFRYLWRSDDGGDTWSTVTRILHSAPCPSCDTRFVNLLPVGDALYLFGYEGDASGFASPKNSIYDGKEVTALDATDALGQKWSLETLALPDGTALLTGVDVGEDPLIHHVWHVAADGTPTLLDSFAGWRVAHLGFYPGSEEILYLVLAGDAYGSEPTTFEARVLVADLAAPGDTVEIASYESDIGLYAVAFFDGALFLSTADSRVLKAEAK